MDSPEWTSVTVGMPLPEVRRGPVARTELVRYAGAAGDFNPVHFDESVAKRAGLPKVMVHGMLSMAFLAEVAAAWAGPRAQIVDVSTRFRSMLLEGEELICSGQVTAKNDGNLVVIDLAGKKPDGTVVVSGQASVRLPGAGGR